jgi:anaerobic selenocysteine-containing dehydrogenase
MVRIDRRSFFKVSALGLLGGQAVSFEPARADVSATDFGLERRIPLMCRMCDQFCPAVGVVRDGRLVRVESNKHTPYPGVCGRSRAAVGALYSPDRIKYPLVREGKRGEGRFRRVSWEEALDKIALKLKELRDEGEAHSVAYLPRFHSGPELDEEFFEIYGTPNYFISYGDTCWAGATSLGFAAHMGGPKASGIPILGPGAIQPDYENSEYAILMGRNPGGAIVTYSWGVSFGRAKRNGMRLVVIDPRRPAEAGGDAEWVPIRPGSDAALLLGILNVIMDRKFYDEEYLRDYTNADILIDANTLLPVGTRQNGKALDYLVFDKATGSVTFKSEAKDPALFGSFKELIDGKETACKTGLQMLADNAKQFTPEWAESISTVPAAKVIELAENLNRYKPRVVLDRGYRSERYFSSLREKLTMATINLLLGAFGREGGLFWQHPCGLGHFIHAPKPSGQSILDYYIENEPGWILSNPVEGRRTYARSLLEDKPYRSKVAVIHGQNVVGGSAGSWDIAKALNKLELIVVISPYFDETVMNADIVLPDATYLERDEALSTKFKAPIPTIGVNRKAVEPLFESKDGYWIFNQLAKRVLTEEEYAQHYSEFEERGIKAVWEKQYAGIRGVTESERKTIPPLDILLEQGAWAGSKKFYLPQAMGTPTGKLEVYSLLLAETHEKLKNKGYPYAFHASPLPTWTPPRYMGLKPKLEKGEFVPISAFFPLATFTGAQTRNNAIIKEFADIMGGSSVMINPLKARELSLSDGDKVRITNALDPNKKCYSSVVKVSELIHPDALLTYYSMTTGACIACRQYLTIVSKEGCNPNHVSSLDFIPITAGHPSQDFIVKIEKLS